MSVCNLWPHDSKVKTNASEWDTTSQIYTANSDTRGGEGTFNLNNYIDVIRSKSNISTEGKITDNSDRPFDFFDDEEFAFGINLLNNNVACVGENMTQLIQMCKLSKYFIADFNQRRDRNSIFH